MYYCTKGQIKNINLEDCFNYWRVHSNEIISDIENILNALICPKNDLRGSLEKQFK